ncbi:TonB-dependent receptor domain-containing protein [Bowmanella dokdonensis]|uniref:TonB-dependent receptor n=1 Tax=Bowmanella dokdonensis TaxID=751969 RepID=A0A939DMK7_9ALTE|nr:TonB-dependent receptor [Bowmanella dokdonensis]MBN7825248.1 TonB-dependent receptor [Bowmanella dokdonensis]
MNKKKLVIAIQAIVLSSTSAWVMAEQQVDVNPASNSSDSQSSKSQDVEKISVTGSRIKRDSFSMATPMMSLDSEALEDSGLGELAEILVDEIPSISAGVSNTNSQSSVQNTGLSTIDLRDLGTDRTLTLIDGRRAVSNSYSGNYISLSTIPAAMVDKVEIISGGASAIYGSDAIAGVVNIITESNKTGFEFDIKGGQATEGGAKEFTLDTGYGTSFNDDRGYLYVAASWNREFGLHPTERDRARYESSYDYNTSLLCNEMNTVEGDQCMRDITPDDWRERSDNTLGGTFEGNDWFYHPENGLTEGFVEERDGLNLELYDMLKVPIDKLATAIKVDYDLSDDLRARFQVHYSDNHSVNDKAPEGQDYNDDELRVDPVTGESSLVIPGTISPDNPFVPDAIRESAGSSVSWDRTFAEVGNIVNDNQRTTLRTFAGLQGMAFDNEWEWELSVGYGKFKQEQRRSNEISIVKLRQALDAEVADDGSIQCSDAQARAEGCVPVNIFGYNSITPEAADYIRANPWIDTDITQLSIGGYMTGDLFELPAGPVSTAFGFEYRKDTQEVNVDDELRNLAVTFNDVPDFKGEVKVKEVFAEATMPLLRDAAMAKNLTLDLSLRLADYSQKNIDLMSSYRAGLIWEPVEGYAVRANYARAQRAPNITELISPPRGDYDSFTDICDGVTLTSDEPGHEACRQEPGVIAGINASEDGVFVDENSGYSPNAGNEDLKEETADTYTLGITLAPAMLEGFRLALDYYDITIKDAITSIPNQDILSECYNSSVPFGGDNPFCADITRDSEGQITEIIQRQFNLNEEVARGYDLSLAYDYDLNDLGSLSFGVQMNHVIERSASFEGNDGLETNEFKGELTSGIFTDRATASVTWRYDSLRIRWKTKYKGSMVDDYDRVEEWQELKAENQALLDAGDPDAIANPEQPYYLYYGSYVTHDLSVSYQLELEQDRELKLYGGVRNLFNNLGPWVPNTGDNLETGAGNFHSAYGGGIGRFVYLGAEVLF